MHRGKRSRPLLRCAAALVVALPALAGCSSGSGSGSGSGPADRSTAPSTPSSAGSASGVDPVTASGTPSWTPVTPSATGPRSGGVLELSGTRVGPVAIGADARAVEAALVELLGVPDRTTDGPGCSLLSPVPRERALFWGDFHVLMTAETTTDPRVTLAGWSVSGRATPVPARLPHGIVVGTSTGTDVKRGDPAATTGASLGAGAVLTDTSGVQFVLSGDQPASPVVQVVYGISACE